MENAPEPAALAPLPAAGLGEIFSAGTGVVRNNLEVVGGIWLACGLPPILLGLLVQFQTGLGDRDSIRRALESGDGRSLAIFLGVGLLGLSFGLTGYAATIRLAARSLTGRDSTAGEVLSEGLGRFLAVLLVSVGVGLCVGAGLLAFILPGVWLMARFSLAACAVVVEEEGASAGAARSWALTRGRLGEVAVFVGALFLLGMTAAVALMIAGFIARMAGSAAGAPGAILAGLLMNALQFVLTAWGAACMTKFYLELAARGPRD